MLKGDITLKKCFKNLYLITLQAFLNGQNENAFEIIHFSENILLC